MPQILDHKSFSTSQPQANSRLAVPSGNQAAAACRNKFMNGKFSKTDPGGFLFGFLNRGLITFVQFLKLGIRLVQVFQPLLLHLDFVL